MVVQGLGAVLRILEILEELETQKAQNRGQSQGAEDLLNVLVPQNKKVKKKVSSYHKKYSREFKKLAPKFKKKNGSWKKDGFKRCAAAARKQARR